RAWNSSSIAPTGSGRRRKAANSRHAVIHLDYNAGAPLHPAAAQAMAPWLGARQANASSAHAAGQAARAAVDRARRQVAAAVGAEPRAVVFTSSGTEADALALIGGALARRPRARVVVSGIEHEAVLQASEFLLRLGWERIVVPPEASGAIDPERFLAAATDSTALAALMFASNETGVVQPVAAVMPELRRRGIPLLCDAVQGLGRLPLDVAALGADLVALSAHKIGGPQGVGALIVRRGTALVPLFGGTQEAGRRAGTEAVAAIVGFGAVAAALAPVLAGAPELAARRDRLESGLKTALPEAVVHGQGEERLPNTLAIGFPGADAAALVVALDQAGIAASRGSACQSGAESASHVYRAMGLSDVVARGTLRFSLGPETTERELERALAVIPPIAARAMAAGRTRAAVVPV
ncbi:MAG TPA: cysteine desulfurase family protein, partial [Candidatus Udaeobacter sp.]|nr:cysteine desulfurase family protein [Candidatus Udaeobacter sp.]